MNIISTYVENFGPHEKKLINWASDEGVSALTGKNGTGKTTLVEATFAAFYKDCPSYPTNIYGVVRQGSNGKAVIEVIFEFDETRYRVRRELNAARKTPMQDVWIYNDETDDLIAGPKERDFKESIEHLIGDADLALATWMAAYRSKGDICELDPSQRSDLVAEFIKTKDLGEIAKSAKSARRRSSATIEMHSDRVRDFERLDEPEKDVALDTEIELLEKQIERLEADEKEIVDDIERMSARVEEATRADKLKRDHEMRVEQRERLEAEIAKLAKRAAERAQDQELHTQLAEKANRLARLRKARDYQKEMLEMKKRADIAHVAVSASVEQLEQRAKDASDRYSKAVSENPYRDVTDDELAEIDALAADEKRLHDVEARLRVTVNVDAELQRTEAMIETVNESLASMKIEDAQAIDIDTVLREHKELVGSQRKISTQRQIVARDRSLAVKRSADMSTQIALYKQKKEDAASSRDVIKKQTSRIEHLDIIEQAFGRSGVQALLVESAIKPFEMMASEMMQAASDGRHDVRIETMKENKDGSIAEKMSIIVADESGERDIRQYSGGEQSILSKIIRLAFARWVAERSGKRFGTVFIDEAFDSLDPEHVERLVEMLKNVAPYFDNIITVTPNPVFASLIPNRIDFDAS